MTCQLLKALAILVCNMHPMVINQSWKEAHHLVAPPTTALAVVWQTTAQVCADEVKQFEDALRLQK